MHLRLFGSLISGLRVHTRVSRCIISNGVVGGFKSCSFSTSKPRNGSTSAEIETQNNTSISQRLTNTLDEHLETGILSVIKVPRLGENTSQGKIHKWLKKPGDDVKEGDLLCIIETNEVLGKVHSQVAGVIVELVSQEGCMVNVGSDLTVIRHEQTADPETSTIS